MMEMETSPGSIADKYHFNKQMRIGVKYCRTNVSIHIWVIICQIMRGSGISPL